MFYFTCHIKYLTTEDGKVSAKIYLHACYPVKIKHKAPELSYQGGDTAKLSDSHHDDDPRHWVDFPGFLQSIQDFSKCCDK